jgi:pyruvate kinase
MSATAELAALREAVSALRAAVEAEAAETLARWAPRLAGGPFEASAANLAHFLALRRRDVTELQRRLARCGLSTLGRSEGHVCATLAAVEATLEGGDPDPAVSAVFDAAEATRRRNAEALFGPRPQGRDARVMVTLEPDLALDPTRMAALLGLGADAVRINCAHDDDAAWRAMAAGAREAAAAVGRPVRVLMDLSGPKIRTDAVGPEPVTRLREGDRLLIAREPVAVLPDDVAAACVCTAPAALAGVAAGAPVALDDGKFTGRVERVAPEGLVVRILRTRPGGAKLKADKGVNFPGTALPIAALSDDDRAALDVAAEIADVVGYSFVQEASDMDALAEELAARGAGLRPIGVIAKIETERAFRNLPEIVVAGAARGPFGVMIARGDLGVEIGFARLSEVQEEILWLCEAAHVPVVWATEVLARLVKTGMAARGEFTDAAMGARAECVMLNKGPFIAEGVSALADVLRRAERHVAKKTPQLGPLRSWRTI